MILPCRLISPLVFLCALATPAFIAPAGEPQVASLQNDPESGEATYRKQVRELTTPELERRNGARLDLQRRGYSQTLYGLVRRNGFDSVLAYIKMRLQLEFFLPHDQLIAYFPGVAPAPPRIPGLPRFYTFGGGMVAVPLEEDWTFPLDPWRRK